MKIVILDAGMLNQDGLSWEKLKAKGELHVYDQTPKDLVLERCKDAEIVLTNKVKFGEEQFSKLPQLKYIGELATGYDNIDLQAAKKHNIAVTNIPSYSTESVAKHVFALLLESTNHVAEHNQSVQENHWRKKDTYSYLVNTVSDLHGKTFGIIGFGAIGGAVARIAKSFGMNVIVHTRSPEKTQEKCVDLETLFSTSDVISLHCPLTEKTKNLISKKTLSLMRKEAVLINASRGGLVNEADLAECLKKGKIAYALLDVLQNEPPLESCPLIGLKNCIITPHIGWASLDARRKLIQIAIDNVYAFIDGKIQNQINL